MFDVGYLSTIPNMTVLAPASFAELKDMLEYAVFSVPGPVAVRYPRGGEDGYSGFSGKTGSSVLEPGRDITLVGYGSMTGEVLRAAALLREKGVSPEVVKLNSLSPLDLDTAAGSAAKTRRLLVAEECAAMGCVGERLCAALLTRGQAPEKAALCNLGRGFVPHGTAPQLRALRGIDAAALAKRGMELV